MEKREKSKKWDRISSSEKFLLDILMIVFISSLFISVIMGSVIMFLNIFGVFGWIGFFPFLSLYSFIILIAYTGLRWDSL